MKTPETHTPHKLGANRHDLARREHRAKHPSAESRDVREDRSTRQSKLVTSVATGPATYLPTSRELLRRESGRPGARALAAAIPAPAGARPVSLTLQHAAAAEVFVAGTFNNWNPGAKPMQRTATGEWSVELQLEPGRHEYLFVADGCWLPDPKALDRVENPYGGHNSVIAL